MLATLEVQNPIRAYAFLQDHTGVQSAEYDTNLLPMRAVTTRNARFGAMMDRVLPNAPRVLDAPAPGRARELVVLRLVSAADLTDQTTTARDSALGFAVLHLTKQTDARAYANAQINRTTFFVNSGSNLFTNVKTIDLDRNARLKPHDADNPIQKLYVW